MNFHHLSLYEWYKFPDFLTVSIASLTGGAERPLPCSYNVLEEQWRAGSIERAVGKPAL